MIRIGTNRCGYTGYNCRGIPQLHGSHETVVEGTTITVQHMFNEANELVSAMRQEFDKLPLRIKGMVFAADTINMGWPEGGPHPEVPEISCRYDTDPFSISKKVAEQSSQIAVAISGQTYQYPVFGSTNGWVDLFNACDVAGGTDGYCYRRDVFLEKTLDTEEGGVTVKGHTLTLVDNIPAFVSGNTEYIMGPGLLEPMLDTDFDPIDIDTIPAWEAGDDSFIFTTTVLGAWKGVIDDRFRNVYARLNNIPTVGTDQSLRELKREEYKDAECDNFQIVLASGDSLKDSTDDTVTSSGTTEPTFHVGDNVGGKVVVDLWNVIVSGTTTWYWTLDDDTTPNTYNVTSGVIQIGPYTCTVPAVTGIYAPFYAYLTTSPLEYTKSSGVTDLPVVEGSTISNGSVMPDGGTVSDLTYHATGDDPGWSWTTNYDHTVDAAGTINIKTAHELNENGTADPPADGIGIGGVRIITGAGSDPLTLYKVYHEDCIASAPLEGDAAQVNTKYPSNVPENNGPEYPPDVVYPYDNIRSGTTGTNRLEWGHSAYVPTVNATYEFIHGSTYGTGDTMADAQALAHRYVTSGAITEVMTRRYPKDDINFEAVETDMTSGLADMVAEAQEDYDIASAAYDEDPNPTTSAAKDEALAVLTAANLDSESHKYAGVSGGTPGTAQIVTEIVVSGGRVIAPTPAETAVPTLDAVNVYVHGQFAMATFGYVERTTGANPTSSVIHNAPGTVLTVDEIDTALYEAGQYYYDDIPTIRAVVKYVAEHGGTGATIADVNHRYPPGTTEEPAPEGTPGIVYVYDNIISGATTTESWGGSAYVPSVNGVYDFVHTDITGDTAARALATGATVTNPVGVNYDYQNKAGINPLHIKTITKDKKQTDYWDNIAGGTVYQTTIAGTTPGTVIAIDQIVWSNGSVVGTIDKQVNVPNTMAVYRFVHGIYALAEPGYVDPNAATVSGHVYSGVVHGTPGTVLTVSEINDDVFNGGAPLNYYWEEVPTVYAVVEYVATKGATTATAGYIDITGTSPDDKDSIEGFVIPSGTVGVPGTTVTPKPGYVQPSHNIKVHGTPEKRDASSVDVPTVEAVYNFVHSLSGSTDYEAGVGFPISDAKATPAGMTVVPDTSVTLNASAVPGTYFVASTIETTTVNSVLTTAENCVPTAQAVVAYVKTVTPGQTPDSVAGTLKVTRTEDTTVDPPTVTITEGWNDPQPTRGTVQVAKGVLVAADSTKRNLTPQAVPSVNAVFTFIHGTAVYTSGATEYAYALARPGLIKLGTTSPYVDGWDSTDGGEPGTTYIAKNICVNPGAASTVGVPTVQAVYAFVHETSIAAPAAGATASRAIATGASVTAPASGTVATLTTGATPGTCYVVTNMIGMQGAGVTLSTSYTVGGVACTLASAVPTVEAVKGYVDLVAGGTPSVVGYMIVSDSDPYESIGNIGNTVAAAGTVWTVENILMNGTDDATHRPKSKKTVPTVEAVINYIRGTTIAGTATESSLASAGSITPDDPDEPTDVEFTGGTQGVVNVTSNIIAVDGADGKWSCTDCVPTADAVVKYVEENSGSGGDGVLPNYQGLQATGGPGPNGIGISFLLPVKPNESTWFTVGSGMSYDAVFATEDDTAGTAVSAGDAVSSSVAGYIRLSIIDPGQNQTAGCVRLYTTTASSGVPLYKSNGFALPASGNSTITVSGDSETGYTETVSGDPGRVYISNGVNFGGDRAYSKITAPSVEAVYDFIHGTTAAGVQMLSALATPADVVVETDGDTVAYLDDDATPGTFYVTGDMTVLGTTVTEFNDPQAVPTALAVANYITHIGLGPAVPGTLEATASSEAWDDEDTAVRGTVLVSRNVTVSTTGNTISTVAVPTVDAVNTFVSGYTASPGTINVPSSGDETWSTASVAGIVKVANNVDAAGTQANRKVSETAVPTVYAVKTYVDNHTDSYTGDFHLIGGSTIAVGTAYYPGGSKSTVQTAISSITGAGTATVIWLKIYRTAASSTINAAFTTSYTRDVYTQCVPIVGRSSTSGKWEQWQRGPVIIEGRWE